MGKAELLRDLKQRTGILDFAQKEFWSAPNFSAGVARGIVVELLGNARTEWLLRLFANYPENYIFWCEREPQANPTAIYQRGVALERIKFCQSSGDLQQILRLALESQLYPFIVAPTRFEDVKIFQRFHLLAEKSKCTVFFLADQKFSQAWPISLQVEINSAEDDFQITVQRQKHARLP